MQQGVFDFERASASTDPEVAALRTELESFAAFGRRTRVQPRLVHGVDVLTNEFWTSKQRAASGLHEISYRACFKPQLPRFFIDRLTEPNDAVYDPFMGRGTTPLETALLGRVPIGCDANPLSEILVEPRLTPPTNEEIERRLREIDFEADAELPEDLLVFYHPDTLRQIERLRDYLARRALSRELDDVDRWIRMVAVNRLTGHSPGFFSVYTLPPNQAVSVESQRKINDKRHQAPEPRDVPALILTKSRSLLRHCDAGVRETLTRIRRRVQLLVADSSNTPEIPDASVALVVTSPPFLDVVQYAADNWLRCWFCGIDAEAVQLSVHRRVDDWQAAMTRVFTELRRLLRPGGWVAFEVGEVRSGTVKLEDAALPCGEAAGLSAELILINDQRFTKTANCWGIDNNTKGTNTNRIVLFRKRA